VYALCDVELYAVTADGVHGCACCLERTHIAKLASMAPSNISGQRRLKARMNTSCLGKRDASWQSFPNTEPLHRAIDGSALADQSLP
jgi:hypothetical protein